jgi:hypothetical protein
MAWLRLLLIFLGAAAAQNVTDYCMFILFMPYSVPLRSSAACFSPSQRVLAVAGVFFDAVRDNIQLPVFSYPPSESSGYALEAWVFITVRAWPLHSAAQACLSCCACAGHIKALKDF